MPDRSIVRRDVTLLDLVDSILQRGTSLSADLVLSVADVDLVQLNLRALLASVETVQRLRASDPTASERDQLRPGPLEDDSRPHGDPRAERARPPATARRRPPPVRPPAALAGHRRQAIRIDADPHDLERGLAQLVLTVIELLRQLMERQALHRMGSGSLDDGEIDRLGTTFMRLEKRMDELTRAFGLDREDLNLHLGPLGDLL
jgi:hypothetical protein